MWSHLSGDQIRILDILPHGGTDNTLPICCDITVVALSNNPQYEALSYCWGESNETVDIEVAGNPRSITTNLQAALRHLRLPNRKRSVWIDQLCVNQDDNEERLSQVHLMYNVYSQCNRCLAWLGEIDPEFSVADAKAVLDLILFLSDKNEQTLIPTSISSLRQEFMVETHMDGTGGRSPERDTIPLGSSADPVGRGSVVTAFDGPIYKWLLLRPLLYKHSILETWPLADYLNIQYAVMIWIQDEHLQRDSAFDAAIRWRGRQATVPHDKVFGLRGLWDPSVEMPNTDKCSYETSVAELYTAFTIDILLDENSLALLGLDPRVERGKRTRNIPNWATDMNDSVEYGVDSYYRRWGEKQIYNACAENCLDREALIDATTDPNHHFNVLEFAGIMIDTVDVLASVRLTKGYFEAIPDVLISQMLRDWMDLARSHSRPGSFSNEAFHRLVIGDAMRDVHQMFKRRPNADDLRQVADFVRDGTRDNQWLDEKIMCAQVENQKFFVTKGGMMGLGHLDTEPGDEVWVFDGGNFPFLVKRQERENVYDYDFVGCCYVQGIMFGEAYSGETQKPPKRTLRIH
ncbi:hypothetical protein BGAL_0105g00010 [Botrytis galanthina]|uniref:Heterokaryon incompatibility domain-containing protein n=1 Tax=Botrytis galanthina TaxID=278940 RepID=A0A4V4HV30_9HELO|nr:hypothetical protein BGAL_0105g00010 [Botrytis galanthina]